MIKKVLLIEPPVTRPSDFDKKKVRLGILPPLGLAYIAAVLQKSDIEVKIIDCLIEGNMEGTQYGSDQIRYGLSDSQIEKEIQIFSPDKVGISCLFSAKEFDLINVCKIVKKVNPNIITACGGAHPTAMYNSLLKDPNLDYVIFGEGEYTTQKLIDTINSKNDLSQVDGIAYKENGIIKVNPKTHYIENLDELPLPARHLLKMDKYLESNSPHSGIKRMPFTSMVTSRGCPNKCSFCVIKILWGQKVRYRSPENVLMEIEDLINTYNIKEIHFEDDNFSANKKRTKTILQGIIDKGWDLTLSSPSGLAIHALDEELLSLMKKAGYYSISLAIESGDEDVLKMMHKPVKLKKVKEIIKNARKYDLKTKGFFILGYPGETKEQMQRTIDFAKNANLDWAIFFMATPIPGSDLEKMCREKGYLVNNSIDYIRQFYKSGINTPEFTPEYIENTREHANFMINFENNSNIRLGNYDRAIEDFKEVTSLYPHLDFAHYYLGVAYEKCGNRQSAVNEFEIVLKLNPNYEDAKKHLITCQK